MTTAKDYEHQIKETARRIGDLQEAERVLLDEWSRMVCPYKVGETVAVCGFSHKGKKMVVEEITWNKRGWMMRDKGRMFQWVAIGRVLKKDGTPGKHTGRIDEHDFEEDRIQKASG